LCSPIFSPQIGACFRTIESLFGPGVRSAFQSPQIGACLRPLAQADLFSDALHVSIPLNRGLPSDPLLAKASAKPSKTVSIPSNRGLPSDLHLSSVPTGHRGGLNPLKSGPAFGHKWPSHTRDVLHASQSPQIGACLRAGLPRQRQRDNPQVSIPSNRGLPSDRKEVFSEGDWDSCLNPLKSGPAFGPPQCS